MFISPTCWRPFGCLLRFRLGSTVRAAHDGCLLDGRRCWSRSRSRSRSWQAMRTRTRWLIAVAIAAAPLHWWFLTGYALSKAAETPN